MGNISSSTLISEISEGKINTNTYMSFMINIQILLLKQILSTYPTITYNTTNPISLTTIINNTITRINNNSNSSPSMTPIQIFNILNLVYIHEITQNFLFVFSDFFPF